MTHDDDDDPVRWLLAKKEILISCLGDGEAVRGMSQLHNLGELDQVHDGLL